MASSGPTQGVPERFANARTIDLAAANGGRASGGPGASGGSGASGGPGASGDPGASDAFGDKTGGGGGVVGNKVGSGGGGVPAVDLTEANLQQIAAQSAQVVVVVELWMPTSQACQQLNVTLEQLAVDFGGRFLLARLDVSSNPRIAQSFGVQGVPTVVALLKGQVVPLFQGVAEAAQIRSVLDEVLRVAAENGVSGQVELDQDGAIPPPPLPPLHQAAYDAIERGDLAAAATAYEQALRENPADSEAKVGLEQVQFMRRLDDADPQAVLAAAAQPGAGAAEQLAAADVEIATGQVEAGFDRLLDLIRDTPAAEREELRARLVEYFDIVGLGDPRVSKARRRLASLLF